MRNVPAGIHVIAGCGGTLLDGVDVFWDTSAG
jgi:hypothetical protein